MSEFLPILTYFGMFSAITGLLFLYSYYKVGEEVLFEKAEVKYEEKEYEILTTEVIEDDTKKEKERLEKEREIKEEKEKEKIIEKEKKLKEIKVSRQVLENVNFSEENLSGNNFEEKKEKIVVKYYEPLKYQHEEIYNRGEKNELTEQEKLERRINALTKDEIDDLDTEIE